MKRSDSLKNLKAVSMISMIGLAAAIVACNPDSKKSEDSASPTAAKVEEKKLVNSTTSEVVLSESGVYQVLPPATEMKGLSVENEPIKSTCKKATRTELEVLKAEQQLAEVKDLVESDNSYEQSVDEMATEVEVKKAQLEALMSDTSLIKFSVSKKELLENMEALKSANPGFKFVAAEPKKAIVSIENSNRKVSQVQNITLTEKNKSGSFAGEDQSVKFQLDVAYSILCGHRKVKSSNGSLGTFLTLQ